MEQYGLNDLQSTLKEELRKLLEEMKKPEDTTTEEVSVSTLIPQTWSGSLPENFKFRSCGVRQLWFLYFRGDHTRNEPAYRFISSSHLNSRTEKQYLSRINLLVNGMINSIPEERRTTFKTFEEVEEGFKLVSNSFKIQKQTGKGRKRRVSELSWQTAYKVWTEEKKKKQKVLEDNQSEEEDTQLEESDFEST